MAQATERGASDARLTPAEAAKQIAGLISSSDDDIPPTTDAPADDAATDEQTGPATPPPAETAASDDATPDETYEITVDGETVRVDLDELKSSYSYQAHNTKRAQELDAKLKAAEHEESERTRALAEYAEGLKTVREALEQLQGEPDWAERRKVLSAEDFLKEKADWEASKASTEKLKQKEQELRQEQAKAEYKKQLAYIEAEQEKLKAAWPEWADETKQKAEVAKLVAYARSRGFRENELNAIRDHRVMLVWRDAMQYAALKREPSEQAKKKAPAIRTARPGAAPPPPPPNAKQQQLIEQASRTHRLRDAAEAVKALLPD